MKEKLWRLSPKAEDRAATEGVAGSVSMNSLKMVSPSLQNVNIENVRNFVNL